MTTLVLREMQEAQIQSFEEDPQALQDACDVAAFVFDGSNIESFKAAQDLLLKLAQLADDTIPCVLIAAKDDLGISMVISALVNPLNRLRAILTCMFASCCSSCGVCHNVCSVNALLQAPYDVGFGKVQYSTVVLDSCSRWL